MEETTKVIFKSTRGGLKIPKGDIDEARDDGWLLSFRFLNGIRRTALENSTSTCTISEAQVEEVVLALIKEGYLEFEQEVLVHGGS